MSFTPLHDRVLVRRVEADARTLGGILIPDAARERPQQGEVIAVGEGARTVAGQLIPMSVKPGDRILFGKWSGSETRFGGEELLIINESEILGTMTEPSTRTVHRSDQDGR